MPCAGLFSWEVSELELCSSRSMICNPKKWNGIRNTKRKPVMNDLLPDSSRSLRWSSVPPRTLLAYESRGSNPGGCPKNNILIVTIYQVCIFFPIAESARAWVSKIRSKIDKQRECWTLCAIRMMSMEACLYGVGGEDRHLWPWLFQKNGKWKWWIKLLK